MYRLVKSLKLSDDLLADCDRSHDHKQQELTENKMSEAKCHVTIMLRDKFGSAE